MENYITQLLSDLENAHRPELPLETDDDGSRTIAAVEKWLAQQDEPKHTFSYYCGLQRVQFPPVVRLNPLQIDSVVEAFEYLLVQLEYVGQYARRSTECNKVRIAGGHT